MRNIRKDKPIETGKAGQWSARAGGRGWAVLLTHGRWGWQVHWTWRVVMPRVFVDMLESAKLCPLKGWVLQYVGNVSTEKARGTTGLPPTCTPGRRWPAGWWAGGAMPAWQPPARSGLASENRNYVSLYLEIKSNSQEGPPTEEEGRGLLTSFLLSGAQSGINCGKEKSRSGWKKEEEERGIGEKEEEIVYFCDELSTKNLIFF